MIHLPSVPKQKFKALPDSWDVIDRATELFTEKLEQHPGKIFNPHEVGKLQEQCLKQAEEEWIDHCERLRDSLENR